ncbi:MAG: hypothetical protein HYT07_01910 [Candidatus Levybacteria bacterium]|nr:hypothetical protein [Candidatus Levybacteria bacterium]
MPSLNSTKARVLEIIRKGAIVLLVLLLLFILIKALTPLKNIIFPDSSSIPKIAFGKLPAISFPEGSENRNFTYTLDTITGLLPKLPSTIKVYKIVPTVPNLLALQRTQDKIRGIGFAKEGTQISKDSYQWVEESPPKTITIDIFSSDFTFSTPFMNSQFLETFENSNELNEATEEARSFLAAMSLFPKDIGDEKTKTAQFSIINNSLTPATSISSTNIVRVDFFQKNIDNLPIYYKGGLTSSINLLVGKEQNMLKVVEAHYSYKEISSDSSTYGIKTASEAFIQLKQGKAYIASYPQENEISIKNVSLGYYADESEYLMPVIIFQGVNFIAYVSGVRDEWISN